MPNPSPCWIWDARQISYDEALLLPLISLITSPHGDNFFVSPTILCLKDPGWPKKYRSKGGQVLSMWFSPDVITAMLVHRTKEKKKVFWNLTLSLCKTRAIICYCFVRQHGGLITWLKTIYCSDGYDHYIISRAGACKIASKSCHHFFSFPANRPIRLTRCCTQFKSFEIKAFCS